MNHSTNAFITMTGYSTYNFAYSSMKVWNNILPDVRNCNSLSSFKAGYLKYHFNGF